MKQPGRVDAEARNVAIIGAGPAGLTAARELADLGHAPLIFEKDRVVGGISRTVNYRGYRFDIGGHRFFTKVDEVRELWDDVMGDDFLVRPRLSRIYYRDRFFDYPLRPKNALLGLGFVETVRVAASYVRARFFPSAEERTFEQWVTNRFGRRLYEIFFKTYTEKVWGIPCSEIGADWAAQRIKNLDLAQAVKHALLGGRRGDDEVITTLIDRFHYPPHGPGMMWERWCRRLDERGVRTTMAAEVVGIRHREGRVRGVRVRYEDGRAEEFEVHDVVSSMPLRELVQALEPAPPPTVVDAANDLRYRDFLTVVLIVDDPDLFPDNWIYIHSPDVRVGRVQNFKNWSPEMVPDSSKTSLGLEYFVQQGDELWTADDDALIALGTREMEELGLIAPGAVVDGTVVRMPKAYPVYDSRYRSAVDTIREHLDSIDNLYCIGRNGQHRYNNQDHSMLTGLYAARNISGADHDVWAVNVEPEYHEESRTGDRATPARAGARTVEDVLSRAFARYDPAALGVAVGTVLGGGLLLLTSWALVLGRQEEAAQGLGLLGSFLAGYKVSWMGAVLGSLSAAAFGVVYGNVLGRAINALVDWELEVLLREFESGSTLDPLTES